MIHALIADDEASARRRVRYLLAKESDIEVVGEAANGVEAVNLIHRVSPDLVFLDIQMPCLDGFGVIDSVGVDRMPLVVFITAYDEHAVRAFDVNALDYLLKPFSPSRFRTVLERVRRQLVHFAPHDFAQRIDRLMGALSPAPRYLRQLLVERGRERRILLSLDTVHRILSEGNYLLFRTSNGVYLRRGTLNAIEERLNPEKFRRINRSEIVRLEAVAEFQPWFHGDYRVIMKDGTMLTWSRCYRARMRSELS